MLKKINLLLVTISLLIIFSCSQPVSFIKNKEIENKLDILMKCTDNISKELKSERVNSVYYICFYYDSANDRNYVRFCYNSLSDFKDLYSVLNKNNDTIFVFSNYDISEFVYSEKPYKVDTSDFKKRPKYPDYYRLDELGCDEDFYIENGKLVEIKSQIDSTSFKPVTIYDVIPELKNEHPN